MMDSTPSAGQSMMRQTPTRKRKLPDPSMFDAPSEETQVVCQQGVPGATTSNSQQSGQIGVKGSRKCEGNPNDPPDPATSTGVLSSAPPDSQLFPHPERQLNFPAKPQLPYGQADAFVLPDLLAKPPLPYGKPCLPYIKQQLPPKQACTQYTPCKKLKKLNNRAPTKPADSAVNANLTKVPSSTLDRLGLQFDPNLDLDSCDSDSHTRPTFTSCTPPQCALTLAHKKQPHKSRTKSKQTPQKLSTTPHKPTAEAATDCSSQPKNGDILSKSDGLKERPLLTCDENEAPLFENLNTSPSHIRCEGFDANMEKDCEDSDEELPSVLRSCQETKGHRSLTWPELYKKIGGRKIQISMLFWFHELQAVPLAKWDLVWVKHRLFPHWPALVKNLYYQKKKLKRIVIIFIGEMFEGDRARGLSLNYNPAAVVPFARNTQEHNTLKSLIQRTPIHSGESQREVEKGKEKGLESQYAQCFKEAIDRAEEFVWKRARGEACDVVHFFRQDIIKAPAELAAIQNESLIGDEEDVETEEELDAADCQARGSDDLQDEDHKDEAEEHSDESIMSDDCNVTPETLRIRKEKRMEKSQPLIEYMKSDIMKNRLKRIKEGKDTTNIFHQQYVEDKNQAIKTNCSFGPIEDEHQQEEVMEVLTEIYKECISKDPKDLLRDHNYILSVWLPEAVVYSYSRVRKKGRNWAMNALRKGVYITKAENELRHKEIIATAKNVTEEERERHKLRQLRMLEQARKNFE